MTYSKIETLSNESLIPKKRYCLSSVIPRKILLNIIWITSVLINITNSISEVINLEKNAKLDGYLTSDHWKNYSTRTAMNTKDFQVKVSPKEGTLSDPFVFVSLTEVPTGPENSNFYSSEPGENYVVVPKDQLQLDKLIYISVYCEKECYFHLELKYDDELTINMDNFMSFRLEDDSDLLIKFGSVDVGFELSLYCPQMTKFKAYLQKEKIPSLSNTLTLYPTFIGGYGIELTPKMKGFCKDCIYYLLIVAEDKDTLINKSQIIISLTRIDQYQYLDERFPAFSVVSKDNRRCHMFDAPNFAMIDNVITTLTIFSGSVKLDINPGKFSDTRAEAKFKYDVPINLVVKHNPTDMNFLDYRKIFYCVSGVEDSSYMLKVVMESHTEIAQTYNFLIDGVEFPSYLPAHNVTKYRIVDFGIPRNTTIVLKTAEGNPKLFGYFCKTVYSCHVDNDKIRKYDFNQNIVQPEEYSGDKYLQTVFAPDYSEKCGENPKLNGCGFNAIVLCDGDDECIFDLSFNFEHSSVMLKENTPNRQVISYRDTDYFKFSVTRDVERVTIILNNISGLTTLFASREMEFPPNQEQRNSIGKDFYPDIITYTKKKNGDLRGDYFIGIYAGSFASYSIYYYSESKESMSDPSKSAVQLFNQEIIKDYLYTETSKYKVYSYILDYTETNKEDIRIILTPIIGDFEIYVYTPDSKIIFNEENKKFKGYRWSTYETVSDNEIIISKTDKDYHPYGTYHIVIALLEDSTYQEASYYLGLSDETNGLNLQANVPVVSVLKHDIMNVQIFNYQITEYSSFLLNINVFSGAINLDLSINNQKLAHVDDCKSDCSLSYLWDEITSKCSTKICNAQITLTDRSTENDTYYNSSKFYLIVKSNLSEAELLYPGFKKHGEVENKGYDFYYAFIPKNEESMVTIFFTDADGKAFGKLINHAVHNKEEINSLMPKNNADENINFTKQYWNNVLVLDKKKTEVCEEFCTLLVSVKGENDFYNNNKSMEYDISLSYSVVEISINKPMTNSITKSQYQFYRIDLSSSNVDEIQDLIFTLTTSEGDCDLYVSYGERLPTMNDYDFKSSTFETELIQINLDDPFFKDNKITSLRGVYTIGVFSWVNSTYTLFASPSKSKLILVQDYYPSSCKAKKGEDCMFSYLLDWVEYAIDDVTGSVKAIVYLDFSYGTGSAVAKLIPKLSKDIDSIKLSKGENKLFTNEDRNYIKLNFAIEDYPEVFDMEKLNNKYYLAKKNGKSTANIKTTEFDTEYLSKLRPYVLIKVTCLNDCSFDIHTAIRYFDDEFYLDPYYDNLVYMPKNYDTNLFFYNYNNEKSYDIQFTQVEGTTNFELVAGENSDNITEYHKNSKSDNVITSSFSINTINSESKTHTVNIYKPGYNIAQIASHTQSLESFFFVRVLVHHDWTKLKPGSNNKFPIDINDNEKNKFFTYLEFLNLYNSVTINFECKQFTQCNIEVYTKNIVFSEKTGKNALDFNSIPAPTDLLYDEKATSRNNSNSAFIKLNSPKKEAHERVIILLSIVINNQASSSNELLVTVTPQTNDSSFEILKPGVTIYAIQEKNEKGANGTQSKVHFHDYYVIKKDEKEDNTVQINISVCFGNIEFKVYDTPEFDPATDKPLEVEYYIVGGKNILKVLNVVSDLYLVVSSNEYEQSMTCEAFKFGEMKCNKEGAEAAQFSVSYFSFHENEKIKTNFINSITFSHEDEYEINFKPISKRIDLNAAYYKLFVTNDEDILKKFASPCFLGLIPSQKDITSYIKKQAIGDKGSYKYVLDEFKSGKYFVNIAVILTNGEIYAYSPVEVIIEKPRTPLFAVIAIIIACIIAGLFFFKYRKTKNRLNLERQDISNMASTNQYKTDKELKDMKEEKEKENIKYTQLSLDSSNI